MIYSGESHIREARLLLPLPTSQLRPHCVSSHASLRRGDGTGRGNQSWVCRCSLWLYSWQSASLAWKLTLSHQPKMGVTVWTLTTYRTRTVTQVRDVNTSRYGGVADKPHQVVGQYVVLIGLTISWDWRHQEVSKNALLYNWVFVQHYCMLCCSVSWHFRWHATLYFQGQQTWNPRW